MNIDEEFGHLKQAINGWKIPLNNAKLSQHNSRMKKEQALKLLKLHLINFQYLVNTKRRKAHLKWVRKQRRLRDLFIQAMQEIQINYIEKLTTIIMKHIIDNNNNKNNKTKTKNKQNTNNNNDNNNNRNSDTMRWRNRKPIDMYSDVILLLNAQEWLETFRMSNKTFTMMCVRLWQAQQESPNDTLLEVEKRIALALYIFAKGINIHSIAHMFNVTFEELQRTLQWFVNIFLNVLASALICMPKTEQEDEEIRNAFQQTTKIPALTIGVMSIFHLSCHDSNSSNDKDNDQPNAIVQVLVDDCLLFRKVEISLEQMPTLFLCHTNDIKYIRWSTLNGKNVSSFVAAPNYYPLRTWLMKPYHKPQKSYQFKFNEAMKHLSNYPVAALKRLYGRWQILTTLHLLDDQQLKHDILRVCCALHNMLEELEEYYDDEWLVNMDVIKYVDDCPMESTNNNMQYYDDRIALTMRDTIAQWMEHQ